MSDERVHVYLSTACLHDLHEQCQSAKRIDGGPKVPGKCKFCPAPCICTCHEEVGA